MSILSTFLIISEQSQISKPYKHICIILSLQYNGFFVPITSLVDDFLDRSFAFKNSIDLDLWSLLDFSNGSPCSIGCPCKDLGSLFIVWLLSGIGLSSRVKWSKSPKDRLWWKLSARRIMAKGRGLCGLILKLGLEDPWWLLTPEST